MIYGRNFNNTELPPEARAFPKTVKLAAPRKDVLRIVGMTNNPDAVRAMMTQATNGKRILTTREVSIKGVTWWAVYAG